jgi:hypothetical protein
MTGTFRSGEDADAGINRAFRGFGWILVCPHASASPEHLWLAPKAAKTDLWTPRKISL